MTPEQRKRIEEISDEISKLVAEAKEIIKPTDKEIKFVIEGYEDCYEDLLQDSWLTPFEVVDAREIMSDYAEGRI